MTAANRDVAWTVVSWNAHGSAEPDIAAAGAALGALGADVLALQEVRRHQAASIAGTVGGPHTWALKHYIPALRLRHGAEGMAIVTPHRLTERGVQVISAKRRTWSWRRRLLQEALVERDDHTGYRVINVHLSPEDLSNHRLDESSKVAARVGAVPAPAAIVAGDLNEARHSAVVDTLEAAGLRDAWRAEGMSTSFTSPAHAPMQTLDHVLVPAAATVVSVDVPPGDWSAWSDHLPVRATFTLPWVTGDFL